MLHGFTCGTAGGAPTMPTAAKASATLPRKPSWLKHLSVRTSPLVNKVLHSLVMRLVSHLGRAMCGFTIRTLEFKSRVAVHGWRQVFWPGFLFYVPLASRQLLAIKARFFLRTSSSKTPTNTTPNTRKQPRGHQSNRQAMPASVSTRQSKRALSASLILDSRPSFYCKLFD